MIITLACVQVHDIEWKRLLSRTSGVFLDSSIFCPVSLKPSVWVLHVLLYCFAVPA